MLGDTHHLTSFLGWQPSPLHLMQPDLRLRTCDSRHRNGLCLMTFSDRWE